MNRNRAVESAMKGRHSRFSVARVLIDKIADGTYGEGARLPSMNELAQLFGISDKTAREALQILVREGLATARVGSGYFVARTVTPIAVNERRPLEAPETLTPKEAEVLASASSDGYFRLLGRVVEAFADEELALEELAYSRLGQASLLVSWQGGPDIAEVAGRILPALAPSGRLLGIPGLRLESATDLAASFVWLPDADVTLTLRRASGSASDQIRL